MSRRAATLNSLTIVPTKSMPSCKGAVRGGLNNAWIPKTLFVKFVTLMVSGHLCERMQVIVPQVLTPRFELDVFESMQVIVPPVLTLS